MARGILTDEEMRACLLAAKKWAEIMLYSPEGLRDINSQMILESTMKKIGKNVRLRHDAWLRSAGKNKEAA